MLDGRVLEASQVEYKPFGKPPLQREIVFFFTIHTPSRQSWRGHRIATLNPGVGTVNPGVGTGLPHSILAWAQSF